MKENFRLQPQLFAIRLFPRHTRLPWSRMHRRILSLYRNLLRRQCPLEQRPARRLAIIAPRTSAKSTLKSLILPLHSLLYRQERYIVLISATQKQARQRLRNIKAEILRNPDLNLLYGPELASRDGWTSASINVNGVQIDAYSAGSEIRGISYREWRPSLVILDDVEDENSVYSADQREKLRNWFNETIEHIGDTYTAIEVIGTLLHPDSLLANLDRRPDFKTLRFSSILNFAHHADLWEQWKAIYTNLDDGLRAQSAQTFYSLNRPAMDAGAAVLWPEQENYYELQCQIVTRGRRDFFKEKQNEPTLVGEVFFDLTRATRFRILADTLEILPPGVAEPQFGPNLGIPASAGIGTAEPQFGYPGFNRPWKRRPGYIQPPVRLRFGSSGSSLHPPWDRRTPVRISRLQ